MHVIKIVCKGDIKSKLLNYYRVCNFTVYDDDSKEIFNHAREDISFEQWLWEQCKKAQFDGTTHFIVGNHRQHSDKPDEAGLVIIN